MSESKRYSELAVALQYDSENAPRVTASGDDLVARHIIELARKHGVPLHEDVALVRLLAQIPLGDEIPETLYRAVAEVISFAYLVSGRRPPGWEDPSE